MSLFQGDYGDGVEFPPADMRGVPQPSLTAKVLFWYSSLVFLSKNWRWLTNAEYPCHHILVGSMPLLTLLLSNVGLMSLFPGLCHYSLHAGSVGLLNTLDTKVRTFSIFSVPTKALYITICHYRPAHCTNMLLFHNATALRSVSILSLLSLPSITRFTWFTSSHDKAYPCS